MKNKYIFLFLFLYPLITHAQTYAGLSIGREFTKILAVENSVYFRVGEPDFKNKSTVIGLRLEQQISNDFYFSLQSMFSKKKVIAGDRGIIPYKIIHYSDIRTALAFNWAVFSSWSLGAGLSFDYIPAAHKIYRDKSTYKTFGKRKELAAVFSTSYLV